MNKVEFEAWLNLDGDEDEQADISSIVNENFMFEVIGNSRYKKAQVNEQEIK